MGVAIKPKDHLCEVCYWRTNLKLFEFEREEEFTSGVVKKVLKMKSIICVLLLPLIVAGWGQKYEKIRLRDVQVLTLRAGEMTTGRRSSPVPQLSCVGGSGAGRGWEPQVVQCYNRGWDGRDVQWEFKADMEGTVRFGKVEVICEGYDYAEDDYILAGSCGLEYTLELTREGKQQNSYSGSGGGGWFSNQKSNSYSNYGYDASQSTSGLSDLIIIVVACILIYAFYKTCIDSNSLQDTQYSSTNEDYSGGYPGAGGWADPNRGSNNYGAWLHVWKQRKHRIQKLWRIQQRLGMGWWRIQQRIYRRFLYYWWWRRVFLVIWYQDSFWIWWNEEEINTKIVYQHCVKLATCNEIVRKL